MEAVKLVRQGWSIRKVGRHLGFHHTAVMRWLRKAPDDRRVRLIPTLSSRPYHHPGELSDEIIRKILEYRQKYRRCAEVIHYLLQKDGIRIGLSSVKRTLKRNHLTYPSRWKKWHTYPERPIPEKPGILVQIDTIHDGPINERLYIYALLDVCSRWGWAWPSERITTHRSLKFVELTQKLSPFNFRTLQSDHGAEFSKWFTKRIIERGMAHRHSRIRTPSDNGHVERFIRTLQDECLSRIPRKLRLYQKEIPEYLLYYNTERPHMALNMKTPIEVVTSY
jgi:transposase InsO family protein